MRLRRSAHGILGARVRFGGQHERSVELERSLRPVKRLKVVALVAAVCAMTQLVAAAARAEIPALERVRVLASPRMIANAELTDQDGAPFELEALQGKVT